MRRKILIAYDAVRGLLWALVMAWAVFAVYLVIEEPDLLQRLDAIQDEDLARQDIEFCDKYGPAPKSHENVLCTMELKRIHDRDKQRFSSVFWW